MAVVVVGSVGRVVERSGGGGGVLASRCLAAPVVHPGGRGVEAAVVGVGLEPRGGGISRGAVLGLDGNPVGGGGSSLWEPRGLHVVGMVLMVDVVVVAGRHPAVEVVHRVLRGDRGRRRGTGSVHRGRTVGEHGGSTGQGKVTRRKVTHAAVTGTIAKKNFNLHRKLHGDPTILVLID